MDCAVASSKSVLPFMKEFQSEKLTHSLSLQNVISDSLKVKFADQNTFKLDVNNEYLLLTQPSVLVLGT